MKTKKKIVIKSKTVLWDDLVTKYIENGFNSFTPTQKTYFSVSLLLGEVANGGFLQYFHNSSSDYIQEALDGLKQLRATKSISIVERAIKVFFPNGITPDFYRERRIKLKNKNELISEWKDVEYELTREFEKDPDHLIDRLESFADKNKLYELSDAIDTV